MNRILFLLTIIALSSCTGSTVLKRKHLPGIYISKSESNKFSIPEKNRSEILLEAVALNTRTLAPASSRSKQYSSVSVTSEKSSKLVENQKMDDANSLAFSPQSTSSSYYRTDDGLSFIKTEGFKSILPGINDLDFGLGLKDSHGTLSEPPPVKKTEAWSIVSFVSGIMALLSIVALSVGGVLFWGISGIVSGIISMGRFKENKDKFKGKRFAVMGTWLSAIAIAVLTAIIYLLIHFGIKLAEKFI